MWHCQLSEKTLDQISLVPSLPNFSRHTSLPLLSKFPSTTPKLAARRRPTTSTLASPTAPPTSSMQPMFLEISPNAILIFTNHPQSHLPQQYITLTFALSSSTASEIMHQNPSLILSPLQLPFPSPNPPTLPVKFAKRPIRIAAFAAAGRPRRRAAPPSLGGTSETDELVRMILNKSGDGKQQPLVSTLGKYAKAVRTEHCFLLFEELGKRDNWLHCLEVFRWMQKQRWYIADNGIYSKLISVMGKKGQTRMAMWLFSEMRSSGCRPDTSVYNALITAHLHSRDKAKALAKASGYFQKMKGIERCQPNIVTYNIILRAYAQAGDVQQVEALFKDLDSSIVSPDIYTFNGVMDGYGKNGMIKEMESILLKMKSNQLKPDVITFNVLIDSYGRKQVFDKMEQVFKSLLRSKERPTLPTFNSMILNYGKARLIEKAEMVFQKMSELGFKPSIVTHESLITTYGLCDCVSRARQIFDEIVGTRKEVPVSTLNTMLDAYCINGLATEADRLLDDASEKGLVANASTYKLLYKAYTRANQKVFLDKLLKRMDQEGIVPNKKFFLEALGAFSSSRTNSESNKETSSSSRTNSKSNKQINSSSATRSLAKT